MHAKVFMLGKTLVVIGSMNLTNAGFVTNAELGIAILGNDSKFKTLENRLKEIESHSYELTPEAYSWKIKHAFSSITESCEPPVFISWV